MILSLFFAAIKWNPNPDIFTLPYLNHSVKWYGALFMGGFIAGFFILLPLLKAVLKESRPTASDASLQELAYGFIDRLTWWVILGTIVGARLGHVFFYDWPSYQNNWLDILKVWEGGLASHGGTLGVLLAVFLYTRSTRKKFPEISFLKLCDLLTIPVSCAAIFIRIGNFINQEILGTPTSLPWGILFGSPVDGSSFVPRHPVQLYEALAYFCTFILMYSIWKFKKQELPTGFLLGLFFICIFTTRFILEFFKASQGSQVIDETFLHAGQILSLPFILLGVVLIGFSLRSKNANNSTEKFTF